ncbi:hypothetical protein FACS1894107_00860 [Planctomycetales bacterium]|nr:hypothetical protein FACS1894107_00860 [Planctomycetales bacterium]
MINGTGTLENKAGGTITVDGSTAGSNKLTLGVATATLKNTGVIDVKAGAGAAELDIALATAAGTTNTGLGTINLNGSGSKAATLTTDVGFTNEKGVITSKVTGTGAAVNDIVGMTKNAGTINVDSGALTTALTANGEKGVITLGKGTTLTTATVDVANDGTININGGAVADGDGVTLGGATGFTANADKTSTINFNSGELTATGVTGFADQNLNFNGGTIKDSKIVALSGDGATANNVSIDLSKYDGIRDTDKAIITTSGAFVADKKDAESVKENTTGIATNGRYNLVVSTNASTDALKDAADEDDRVAKADGLFGSSELQYIAFTADATNKVLYAEVTTDKARLNEVVGQTTSGKIGDGQSEFIHDLLADRLDGKPSLTADIKELADKLYDRALDPVRLSRAGKELNGAINESAQVYNILASAQIFNSTIADLVTDYAIQQSVGTSVFGTSRDSGAMGGRPTGATGSGSNSYATGFVKAYGGFGSQGGIGGMPGYDFQNVGALIGAGYRFARELEVGGLFGYSYNTAEAYHGYGKASDHTLRLGLYGNLNYDNFFFNTTPTFGIHMLSSERYFRELGYGTAKSDDRTGFDFSWSNRLGYVFELPANFFLTPSYGLAMTYYRDPEHSESGARGANLKFDAYDSWSLLQSLELRVGKKINISDCFALLPEFWAGWEHDYLTPNRVNAVLAGDTSRGYSAPVLGIAQDRALLGVGLKTLIQNKYEVSARYDARIWGEGHNQQFNVGLSVKF